MSGAIAAMAALAVGLICGSIGGRRQERKRWEAQRDKLAARVMELEVERAASVVFQSAPAHAGETVPLFVRPCDSLYLH